MIHLVIKYGSHWNQYHNCTYTRNYLFYFPGSLLLIILKFHPDVSLSTGKFLLLFWFQICYRSKINSEDLYPCLKKKKTLLKFSLSWCGMHTAEQWLTVVIWQMTPIAHSLEYSGEVFCTCSVGFQITWEYQNWS